MRIAMLKVHIHQPCQHALYISLIQVFRIAYCGILRTSMLDAYQGTCDAFVQAIKEHNASMLKEKKVDLVLHLPAALREFGPTSAYNTERYTN